MDTEIFKNLIKYCGLAVIFGVVNWVLDLPLPFILALGQVYFASSYYNLIDTLYK